MTFSVLMSVYFKETADRLQRCLDSIWTNQTRKPDQIVIVEDGPLSQELYSVIERWKLDLSDKICILQNQTNKGLTVSLNMGLRYVSSDLVARMDSDDVSAPDRFEKQIGYMETHTNISVLGGSIQEFDEANECILVRHYPKNDIRKFIVRGAPVCHATTVMRMEIFRQGGIQYNEKYRTGQDSDLWFSVLNAGYEISNIDDITYYVYCSNGMMKRRSDKAKTEFVIFTRGIYSLYGIFTWRYIFPVLRYLMRLLPSSFTRIIYGSKLRTKILES